MEEDIRIKNFLKTTIGNLNNCENNYIKLYNYDLSIFENILNRLEQLEKENFELKQREIIHKLEVKPKDNFYEYYDFIPKSVIRDKIEELENAEHEKLSEKYYFDYQCNLYDFINGVKKGLKEILGDE